MWDFSFQKSFSIVAQTWPFLLLRIAVFGLFALVFVGLVASGGIIGHQLGPTYTRFDALQAAIMGSVAGFGLAGAVLRILREYTLYLVKGGHIAVMGELLTDRSVPSGFKQIGVGAQTVRENFAETSTLFVLDQLIKGVLKVIDEFFKKIGMFVPFLIPFMAFFQSLLTIAVTYVDEMILAHIMRSRPANAWRAGADALVIYAQNAKLMFKNAFWLMLAMIAFEVIVFAIFYNIIWVPAELAALDPQAEIAVRVFGSILAVVLLGAIILEPFAVCTMLQVFNTVAYTQTPDPDVERKLAEKSEDFRTLAGGRADMGSAFFQPAE